MLLLCVCRDPQTLRPVPTKVQTAELGSLLLAGGMAPGYVTALALRLLAQHPDVQVGQVSGQPCTPSYTHAHAPPRPLT